MIVRDVLKKSSTYFSGRLLIMLINFVLLTLLARFMGPENYGIFNIALSVIFTCALFVDLGIGQSLVFHIPNYKDKPGIAKDLLNFGIKLRLLGAIIVGAILFFSSEYIANLYDISELSRSLKLFAFAFFSYTIIAFLTQVSIALKKVSHAVLFEGLMIAAKLLSLLMFISIGVYGAYLGYTIGMIISLILGIIIFYKIYPKTSKEKTPKKGFLKYSSFIYLGLLFLAVYSRSIPLILAYFSTPTQVAYLSVGTALTSFVLLAATSIGTIVQPSITDSKRSELPEKFPKIFKFMIFTTVPLGVFGILLANDILNFFYGSEYIAGALIFSITAIASSIFGITFGYTSLALGVGRAGSFLKSQAVQAVTGLIASFLLIPTYEGVGAAVTLVAINLAGPTYLAFKLRGYKVKYPKGDFLKSLLATFGIVFSVLLTSKFLSGFLKMAVSGVLGISLYLAILYLLKGIKKEEIRLILKGAKIV